MPMQRDLYPENWEEIALNIKTKADWTCVDCKRPCRRPGESEEDLVARIKAEHPDWEADLYDDQANLDQMVLFTIEQEEQRFPMKLTRFILTTAHLDHKPENCDEANLRAWCSVCHCRYDLKARATKRRLKRERLGQGRILEEPAIAPI